MSGRTPIRAYVQPTGLHSRAMIRVADALARYAPTGVEIAPDPSPSECDLIILHVIGSDAITAAERVASCGQRYAVIQYCLVTAGYSNATAVDWVYMWQNAACVWSYYDLSRSFLSETFELYYAPLGLDDAFLARTYSLNPRLDPLVLTSGYVSGPGAESIAEVWAAAERLGINAIHIGPSTIEGMSDYPLTWVSRHQISDSELAELYRRASWVAALRHVEGFELPAAEGLACGARPIVFDQPAMRHWYGNHALYVKDQSGPALVNELVAVMSRPPDPVTDEERAKVIHRFNWERVCTGFWQRVLGTDRRRY
jgi:glycosyltransferase involved in cell wall biosynthesis